MRRCVSVVAASRRNRITRDEIVDVAVTGAAGPLATCLLETTWQVRLDSRWDRERESFVVDLERSGETR